MKNLVSIVNTGTEVTKCGITFPTNTPVPVYRNRAFWLNVPEIYEVLQLFVEGFFVSYAFDGTPNTAEESVQLFNDIRDEAKHAAAVDTYSPDYYWFKSSSEKMIQGFLGELDAFDFEGENVTQTRADVLLKVHEILMLLNVGYLKDAAATLSALSPDTPDDFLSPTRVAQFAALCNSAST